MIRPARPADADALTALANAAYQRYVERIGTPPAPMLEDYAALIGQGQVWVAEHDDAILGLLVLILAPGHLLLDNIAVAPDAQGTGLGARLLEFAEQYARAHDRAEIRLYTNEVMTENLGYYPRHGYLETHRALDNGYRRVFFAKRLG